MNNFPITVIDDFYTNPDEVRQLALNQKYRYNYEQQTPNIYPGQRSDELNIIDKAFSDKFWSKIFSVFFDLNYQHYTMKCEVSSCFQLITEDYETDWIHQDGTVFSGVIYLTPDAPLDCGTSVYKSNSNYDFHRNGELGNIKYDFYHDNIKPNNYTDSRMELNSMFTETVAVNNLYNRAIIYDGTLFHGAKKFFGNTLATARLTQVFSLIALDTADQAYPLRRLKQY
jgi:Family of unknown function (DUF6445)